MWDGVTVVTKPAKQPITVDRVKSYIDVVRDDQDDMIGDFIRGAVSWIDGPSGIGYAMMEQTWRKTLGSFPFDTIHLPGAPIKSVTSITYLDNGGDEQTVDPSDYRIELDVEPVRVRPARGKSWPPSHIVASPVRVDYVLGESDPANVEPDLIDAICLLVAHRYANREAVLVGSIVAQFPFGFEAILNKHRRGTVAA